MPQAGTLDGAVREVDFPQRGDVGEALQPVVGHAFVAAAFALERVVAVVEIDRGRDIENLRPGVGGREVEPLRRGGRADEAAAEFLDLRLEREGGGAGFHGALDCGQQRSQLALQIFVRHPGDERGAVRGGRGREDLREQDFVGRGGLQPGQKAVEVMFQRGFGLRESGGGQRLAEGDPHGVVHQIFSALGLEVDVVAIQIHELRHRGLLCGDVLGDLREKVLGEGLAQLAAGVQAAQFGEQGAEIAGAVEHLLRRRVAGEFVRALGVSGPAGVDDEHGRGLELHPGGNGFHVLGEGRAVVRLHGDDVVLPVAQGGGPERGIGHAGLARVGVNVAEMRATIDVPLHVTGQERRHGVPRQ